MSGKKFTFPLETVLKVRHHETEEARQALVSASQSRAEFEKRAEEARLRLIDVASSGPTGMTGAMAMRQFDAFRRDAFRACTDAEKALTAQQRNEEEARGRLVARRGEEEVLIKLREQHHERYQEEQSHAETAFLDEQAVKAFHRKSAPSY